MSDPDDHIDPSLNEPGSQDQPDEFIDTPENEPGDQSDVRLSDAADPRGIDRDQA